MCAGVVVASCPPFGRAACLVRSVRLIFDDLNNKRRRDDNASARAAHLGDAGAVEPAHHRHGRTDLLPAFRAGAGHAPYVGGGRLQGICRGLDARAAPSADYQTCAVWTARRRRAAAARGVGASPPASGGSTRRTCSTCCALSWTWCASRCLDSAAPIPLIRDSRRRLRTHSSSCCRLRA